MHIILAGDHSWAMFFQTTGLLEAWRWCMELHMRDDS